MTIHNRKNKAYGKALKQRIFQDGPIEPEIHSETGYTWVVFTCVVGGLILIIYTAIKYLPPGAWQ